MFFFFSLKLSILLTSPKLLMISRPSIKDSFGFCLFFPPELGETCACLEAGGSVSRKDVMSNASPLFGGWRFSATHKGRSGRA